MRCFGVQQMAPVIGGCLYASRRAERRKFVKIGKVLEPVVRGVVEILR
jgi:hypothetical protein